MPASSKLRNWGGIRILGQVLFTFRQPRGNFMILSTVREERSKRLLNMNKSSKVKLTLGLAFLISFSFIQMAKAESMNEIFQTVAFLQGEFGEIQRIPIDDIEYEVWLKAPGEDRLRPHRKSTSGTGFFVRKGSQIYLITAEHVASHLKYDVKVTVHGSEGKPETYGIKDLTRPGEEQFWFFHPEADVALLPLKPTEEFKGIIKALEPNMFLMKEEEFGQYKNRVLTTVGFPLKLGIHGKFSPIIKSSKAASNLLSHKRADKNTRTNFLILDDPSVQGFSGAPVYALSDVNFGGIGFKTGRFACVGLVHGTLHDNTGGKFAAVVPAYYIIQTIEKFEAKK